MAIFTYLKEQFLTFHHSAMERMIPQEQRAKDPLLYWRGCILLAILLTALGLSLFLMLPTIPLLINEKLWGLAFIDFSAIFVAFGLVFSSLKYRTRAAMMLLLTYAIGVMVIFTVGPLSGGPAWLFTFAIISGVLLGAGAAAFAIILNSFTFVVMGWLVNTGRFGQTFPFFNTWESMLAAGFNFTILSVLCAVSVSALLKGLAATHEKDKILFRTQEQKKAWEALERSVDVRTRELKMERDRSQQYLDVAGVMILALDARGRVIQVNRKGCEILEGAETDIIGKDWFENFVEGEDFHEAREVFRRLMKGQLADKEYVESEIVTQKGQKKLMAWYNAILRDENGKIVGTLSSGEDIAARRQVEEKLLKSEQGYRDLFDSMTDLIFTQDLEGRFISANQALSRLFGYEIKDLMGKRTSDFMKPEMKPYFQSEYLDKIKTDGYAEGVTIYFTRDGRQIYLEYHSSLVIPEAGEPYISGSGRDVTERITSRKEIKRLQDQIVQSQKMEAIGLMAGGVAHDLNNILSGIVSYPELLLLDLPEDSPLRKPLITIQEAGKRAADVVTDLLTVARGVAREKGILNLNTIVSEFLDSPEFRKIQHIRRGIEFPTQCASDLLNMSGSGIHMKKILMNLVMNASEAIEGEGSVTISTRNRYLDESFKGHKDILGGEYVQLSVADNGSGISPGDLERIFEPFYTKKVMGRSGTGLGLAVVWNTVQDHDGHIHVRSSEKGTVFDLYFPVSRDDVLEHADDSESPAYQGYGETILVVDDEAGQREIACGILEKLGYRPQSVAGGEAAVAFIGKRSVDLVLLDMVMPKGLSGRETYEEILKINPGQKAVIATGYAKTEDVDVIQKLGAGRCVKKPYSLKELAAAVRDELAPVR